MDTQKYGYPLRLGFGFVSISPPFPPPTKSYLGLKRTIRHKWAFLLGKKKKKKVYNKNAQAFLKMAVVSLESTKFVFLF
jgi:hypothetical protein